MPLIELIAAGPERSLPAGTTAPPHILFIVDGFPKALGGGERVILRLAAELPKYGFQASILTLALHPNSSFRAVDAPCPVYLLPLSNTYGLRAMRAALALRRFLREKDVALVQTFFESSDLWAGLVTRMLSRAKLVWSRRDMGILRSGKHHLAYSALRRLPHAVSAVSARVAEHVVTKDKVPRQRVHVVHNGLDLTPRNVSPTRQDSHQPVITTIGNIRPVKGHDLLVRAASQVVARYPRATFTIAGEVLEATYFAELQRTVENQGLTDRFLFLGKITDLQAHLEAADLFVLPSRSEGFSNALVEAMAAELPCIATDVGGNAEALQDGVSGLVIPSDDAGALAEAILRLLDNPQEARRLAKAAKISAELNFSSAAMLQKTTELYHTLLQLK